MPGIKTLKRKARGRGRPKGSKNKPKFDPTPIVKSRLVGGKRKLPFFLTVPGKENEEIWELSSQTKISPEAVLVDVIKTGLIAVRKLYMGLIENRRALQEEYEKNLANGDVEEAESRELKAIATLRRPDLPPMATAASPASSAPPDDASFGRRLQATPDSDTQESGVGSEELVEPEQDEFPLEEEAIPNE